MTKLGAGGKRGLGLFALILLLHGLLLAWLSGLAPRPPDEAARPFSMRMVAAESLPREKPTPLANPPPHRPSPAKLRPATSAPVLAITSPAPAAAAAFSVPVQPVAAPMAAPQAAAPAPAAPVAVTAASFDADYLHNPKPVYPALSRRMGEEGRVVLKVMVRPDGTADTIEIANSSSYPRLDQAARDAVQHWRFVPARRGETPVAASVRVPLLFRLEE